MSKTLDFYSNHSKDEKSKASLQRTRKYEASINLCNALVAQPKRESIYISSDNGVTQDKPDLERRRETSF